LRAIYSSENNLEWTQPMALGETPFGEIRIGLTMALVRRDLNDSLGPSALAAGIALLVAVLTSMLLAQLVLRPMHVIRSSLSRLGRGDLGATLDLRDDAEFRELGDVFDQVSAQLRAASPAGIKPAQLAELSRRISMVGRLTAGVAHEMKNPLNAMTIHLELLKQKLAAGKSASQHVEIIEQEIRRLDERIQGFLRCVRPDEAKFGPVAISPLLSSVLDAVNPEAQRAGVSITRERARRIAPEEVLAIGDMPNDIALLEWAGTSYAMGNAHPTVQAVADHVAPSNDDDGVARVIEDLLAHG